MLSPGSFFSRGLLMTLAHSIGISFKWFCIENIISLRRADDKMNRLRSHPAE